MVGGEGNLSDEFGDTGAISHGLQPEAGEAGSCNRRHPCLLNVAALPCLHQVGELPTTLNCPDRA